VNPIHNSLILCMFSGKKTNLWREEEEEEEE
jgi:hypothetical protein